MGKKSSDQLVAPSGPGEKKGIHAGFTVGRAINSTIALIFFLLLLTSLIVIGTMGHTQTQVKEHSDSTNHSHQCILYASCKKGSFEYSTAYSCEFVSSGFAIIGGLTLVFIAVAVYRVVVAADIWFTAIVETVVFSVLAVFAFTIALTISIGLAVTCGKVKDCIAPENYNHCNQPVPNTEGKRFYFFHSVNASQAAAWLSVTFLAVIVLIFIVRMVIYLRRRKRLREDRELLTAHDHLTASTASTTKPI